MRRLACARLCIAAFLAAASGLGGYTPQSDPVPRCDADPQASLCYAFVSDVACATDELKVEVRPTTSVAKSTVLKLDCE